jgi:3-oxoacyl-(acyl-carrier-protein) synthase
MILTGGGCVVGACDPTPYLRVRKSRKFMGLQDDLAVVAAGRALESAGLGRDLGERTGLFLAVGYIPFREEDILPVLAASMEGERFDVRRFGGGGFQRAHPLLTFRCLPNMPAYHVSVAFDVQGPYVVTYPGPAQLYAALEEATAALADGRIDVALVGGVAAQSNFLVRHHFARIEPPVLPETLCDASAILVLETEAHARARNANVRGRLESVRAEYTPPDVFAPGRASVETLEGATTPDDGELGPALLGVALARALETKSESPRTVKHVLESRDGVRAESLWVLA